MFGVGIFALLGCDDVAWADYDGTEHPRNHTHEVRLDRQTDVRLETDSPYGLRHHESYNVVVDPPFHFSNQFVYVKIVDQTATHGYDFQLYLPERTGSTDNTKVLRLPVPPARTGGKSGNLYR